MHLEDSHYGNNQRANIKAIHHSFVDNGNADVRRKADAVSLRRYQARRAKPKGFLKA
jgi:hypothetical protein